MHTDDRDLLAPGLATLQAPLEEAKAAPALLQQVLLASGSWAALLPLLQVLILPQEPHHSPGDSSMAPSWRGGQKGWRIQALPISLLTFLLFLVSANEVPWLDISTLGQASSRVVAASHRPFSSHMEEKKL